MGFKESRSMALPLPAGFIIFCRTLDNSDFGFHLLFDIITILAICSARNRRPCSRGAEEFDQKAGGAH
jgi:hypothetical protein